MTTPLTKNNRKKPLPKIRRKNNVPMLLVDRDLEILKALSRYRYMRTSQIKRLVFPNNKSAQSTQRRLKFLYHNRFIGRIVPLFQIGLGSGETAYYLDQKGAAVLEDQDVELGVYAKPNKVKYQFLNHALDISDFRVKLELSLQDHPVIELHRFIADFELKSFTEIAIGKRKYKLWERLEHPLSKESYVVYPDALIILKTKPDQKPYQRLLFLEVDRATETLSVIKDKVVGYNLYKKLGIFKKFGNFDTFTVLLQTTSQKRANNIRHALTDVEGGELVYVTSVDKVDEITILQGQIWLNSNLEVKAIVKKKE